MKFAYMDEAGNTGRDLANPEQTFHLIVTVVIDEARVSRLHDHVREVAHLHCEHEALADKFEFHGQALFAGKGAFGHMSPTERIATYEDLLAGLAEADAKVVIQGVDKPGLARRYPKPFHPHDIALMFTCESVERLARKDDCRVLLVADEAREVEDTALRDLANYQQFGTAWGWDTEQIDHIIDTIHFVRSETNPAIQITDCAAFIAARQRKISRGEVKTNEAVTRLWEERILPHVFTNRLWHPG